MKTETSILGLGALALLCTAGTASATVLFDSLPNPTALGQINLNSDNNQTHSLAQSFDVGSVGATLTSVVVSMANEESGVGGPANFTVDLVAANGIGSIPGTVLEALSGSSDPATAGNYTYTSSGTALAANTAYYIEINYTPNKAAYAVNYAGITTGTDSLGVEGTTDGVWSQAAPPNTAAASMEINANLSPVPEPSDWAVISAAMLGSVWIVKRRLAPVRS